MKKHKGFKQLFILCFSLILILAGCNSTSETGSTSKDKSSNGEKVLKVSMTAAPGNLDPHFAGTHAEFEIIQPIFNGLVRYKPGTASFDTIEGDLAEEWNMSEDGLTYTFKLREGVQWHKGYGELTSADVKWSLERVMDPAVGSSRALALKFVDSIEAPDKYTVVIKLKEPNPAFILTLTPYGATAGAIVKKEAIEKGGDDASKLVGTGPFMLESYTKGESAILVKNPDYFRGEPKIDRYELYIMRELAAREVAMDKGDIHFSYGEPDGLWMEKRRQNKDLEIQTSGLPMVWSVQLNQNIKPLDDIKVRQAIAHAINYDSIVEMLGAEITKPMTSNLAENVYGHADVGHYEYDPEKAKKLLAEAGYPDGLKLPKAFSPNIPAYTPVNSFMQEQLRQVGIDLPIETVDTPAWITALYSDQSSVTLTIGLQGVHGAPALFGSYHTQGVGNFTHYNKSDALIDQLERELDEKKFMELAKQIQQQIYDEYVNIPLVETLQVQIWRKDDFELGYDLKDTPLYVAPIEETTDLK